MAFKTFTRAMAKSVRKKAEPSHRNLEIAAKRKAGMTYAAIGRQYAISGPRCRQICRAVSASGDPK